MSAFFNRFFSHKGRKGEPTSQRANDSTIQPTAMMEETEMNAQCTMHNAQWDKVRTGRRWTAAAAAWVVAAGTLLAGAGVAAAADNRGFWDGHVSISINGGAATDYALSSFNGTSLGEMGSTSTITITAYSVMTWTEWGGSFSAVEYYYIIDGGDSVSLGTAAGEGYVGNNQKWSKTLTSANLLSGVSSAGSHTIQIYGKLSGSGTPGGDLYDNNGGNENNYQATFTYVPTQDVDWRNDTGTGTTGAWIQSNKNPWWYQANSFARPNVTAYGPQRVRINNNSYATDQWLTTATTVASLTFGASATTAHTIYGSSSTSGTGGNALTVNEAIINSSTKQHTLSLPVVLGGNTTVNTASGNLKISGAISGSHTLTKTGSSKTLTLDGANSYEGATTIEAGIISIAADNSLGAAPASATDGYLTFGGDVNVQLTTTASFELNSKRGIALNTTGSSKKMTIYPNSGTTLTYNGVIKGSGTAVFTKDGPGTLELGGDNTYSSSTTVNAGTLNLKGSLANSAVTVGAATLTVGSSGAHAVKSLTMDNASSVLNVSTANTLSGTGAANITAGTINFDASGWTKTTETTKSWTIYSGGAAATCSGITKSITAATGTSASEYTIAASGNNIVVTWTAPISRPTVTDSGASSVTATSATVSASVNAGGASTTVSFGYSTTSGSYGTSATVSGSPVTGRSDTTVSVSLGSPTALTPGATYYYQWSAYNSVNGSSDPETDGDSFTTLAEVPGAPTLASGSSSSITVAIDTGSNDSSVRYAIKVVQGGTTKYVKADGTLGASAVWQTYATWGASKTVSGLSAATTYTVSVAAMNSEDESTAYGSTRDVTTASGVQKPTITENAKTITTTTASLPITVNMGGGATTADIALEYKQGSGSYSTANVTVSPLTLAANVTAGAVSGSISSLSAGKAYTYKWTVQNSAGSTTKTGYFATVPSAPTLAFVSSLTYRSDSTARFTLTRTNGDGAGTLVVVKADGYPTWTPTDGAMTSVTASGNCDGTAENEVETGEFLVYKGAGYSAAPIDLTGLSAGTHYYARAYVYQWANNEAATYKYSAPGQAEGYTLSSEPTWSSPSLTATAKSTSRIDLSWGTATGASGYLIIRKASGTASSSTPTDGAQYSAGDGETLIWITSGSTTSKSDTELSPNTVYSYRIYAYNMVSGQSTTYNYLTGSSATAKAKTTAAEPTTQASGLGSSTYSTTGAKLTWTKGNGTYTLVAGTAADSLTAKPTDRTAYTASTTYSSGGQIATGVRTVYTNDSTSVTISGLTADTLYTFGAYSFNGNKDSTATTYNYKTDTFPTTQFRTTADAPSAAPAISVSSKTDTTMTFSVTKATGSDGTLVEIYTTEALVDPSVRTTYTANLTYGSGTRIGSKGYVVYMGTDSTKSIQVTGLSAGTTYYVRAYAYNGTSSATAALCSLAYYTGEGAYGSTSAQTWASEPTTQVTGLSVTARATGSLTLGWTKGNGTYTLVVAYTSDPETAPTDGTTYTANAAWGSAGALGSYKVVYAGTGAQVQVTGLSAGTRYYFRAYTYNGIGGDSTPPNYLTGSPATANGYTKPNAPTVGATVDGKTMIRLSATKNGTGGTTGMVLVYGGSTAPTDGTAVPAKGDSWAGGTVVWTGTDNASDIEHVVASGTTHTYRLFAYAGSSTATAYSAAGTPASAPSTAAISGGQVETFSYTNGTGISSTYWNQPDNGWSSTGWDAWDSSSSSISIAQPAVWGKGLLDGDHLGQAGGNAVKFDASADGRKVRAYRAFDSAYTGGKVWFLFTVRTQYGGDKETSGAHKSFGVQFMSTAGSSSTIFASVGKPMSLYNSGGQDYPRLAITTSKDGSGFPTDSSINWAGDYNLVDYGHSSPAGNYSTANCHTVYGYIDLDSTPTKKMYASAAYSTTDFTADAWNDPPSSWDVNGAEISPASKSVAGMTLYSVGYCGDVYFDEVRVATSWTKLMGREATAPAAPTSFTVEADGNELVRATVAAAAGNVIIVTNATGTGFVAPVNGNDCAVGDELGTGANKGRIVYKGPVGDIELVVPAEKTPYFAAYAYNVDNYYSASPLASTPASLAMGTYPSTVAEAFAYTNETHLGTSTGSQTWMNGGKGWAGAWELTSVPGSWAPGKVAQNASGVEGLLETTQLSGAGGNMLVLYPGTTLESENKAALLKRELATALSSGSTWWGMFTMKVANSAAHSWAGIQLIDASGNVKASIGKLWDQNDSKNVAGIQQGSTKGPSTYEISSGGTYVYIFKWDGSKMWLHVQYVTSTSDPNFSSYATPQFTDPDDTSVSLSMADIKYVQLVAENGNSGESGSCVGNTWFDEIRFGPTFPALVGRASTTPDAPRSLSATVDGKEMVRLAWEKNTAGDNVIVVGTTDGSVPVRPTDNTSYSAGDTVSGTTKVVYTGSGAGVDHVVAPGTQWTYAVYSDNGDNLYSTTGQSAGPVGLGTYDSTEYLDTMSYTNGTTEASSGNSWKGGQGWGANYWHTDAGTWTAVRPSEIASTVNIGGTIANSSTAGNAVKLSNPGEGGSGCLERTTGGDVPTGAYNNTFYVAFRMAYSWNDPNRYAGLKLIDTTDGSKGVFIGRTMKDDTQTSVKHSKLGIEAATSSGGTPSVGSAASGTLYALNDEGGADNAYLVVARVKWTSVGYATVDAWSYKVGSTLPATEPSGDGQAHWGGAYLANVHVIQLQAGSTGTDQIGDVYFDEVRFGDSWDDLLGGVPPTQVWLDGQTTTAYRGDVVTNAVKSQPVGERQSAQSLLWSSLTPPTAAAFSGAVAAEYFGKEDSDTTTVWHGKHFITDVSTSPLYGFGAVTGGGTTLYSMDHVDAEGDDYTKHTYNLSVLPKPAEFSAASGGATKINLTWRPAEVGGRTFDEVMIVRFNDDGTQSTKAWNLSESNLHPEQGRTPIYMVGDTIEYDTHRSMTVIFRGTGTSYADTRLTASTHYYYAIYTVNNGYYSEPPSVGAAGRLNADATTDSGSSGGMPEIDGSGSDWDGAAPVAWNSADATDGEFVWNDKKGDLRNKSDACLAGDLDEFRVKADAEWVYFLVRLSRKAAIAAGKTIDLEDAYISVGVDTRLSADSKQMYWLGDESATEFGGAYHGTAAERYPSRQMAVHYVGGSERTWQVEMYAEDGATWYAPPTEGWAVAAAGADTDPCIEWRVARVDLGLTAAESAVTTGRFSVATFANVKGWNRDTKATVNIEEGKSAAVDAMEIVPYGENDKDSSMDAWNEGLKNDKQNINFWADVGFDASGVVANGRPTKPVFSGSADEGHGSPTLTWTQSSDTAGAKGFVTGYLFELSEDSDSLNGRDGGTENGSVLYRVNLKGADNTSYRPQTTAEQFWWRVRARDNGGQLSEGDIRRYGVTGQKDKDGPVPDLLYVGTEVSRFLDPEDSYRADVVASGDAEAVVDSVYSEGTPPTFGFVMTWTDPSGVYATNRSWDSSFAGTKRYQNRVNEGYALDGVTLDEYGRLPGRVDGFAWNVLAEKTDGEIKPFGRVSPNWDLMLVDMTHKPTFSGPKAWTSGANVTNFVVTKEETVDGKTYRTYTPTTDDSKGSVYYTIATGSGPTLQAADIDWAYEERRELETETGEKFVTSCWTHVYDNDLPFLPTQTRWDTATCGMDANAGVTCITNFVSQAFKLPAYDPDVSLYLTVSAEDNNAEGDGGLVQDGWMRPEEWHNDSVVTEGNSHAHYDNDSDLSSGSCNDGPAYARNVTTNRTLYIPVRDDDSKGPEASTNRWSATDAGGTYTPSMLVATQTLSQADVQGTWATLEEGHKLLPRLEGTGQGVTYQLTDAMLGLPLTFLFNVYDQHTTSGLKYGATATETYTKSETVSWTRTNTAFRTRSWDATGYAYTPVASPAGSPSGQGWYEKNANGRYVPSTDASVGAKTYYVRSASAEGWVTSDEDVDGFKAAKSDILTSGTGHGPGTGTNTVMTWEFGTMTEASLSSLFGVANVLDYMGHNPDGVTNLVQLHAWDCDNDRTGDQSESEITFGTLLLSDDDATPPTSPGYALLGSGTNEVKFGALAAWNWTSSSKPATWSTTSEMDGIDASDISAWSVGSTDSEIASPGYTERGTAPEGEDWSGFSTRFMSVGTGGMKGETYRTSGGAKYFQFDVQGENGTRWTADTLQFDNRVTKDGPTTYTLTVQEAANVTTLASVTADGQKDAAWTVTGGLFEKVGGIPRFTLESTGGSASLGSPAFQPNSNGRAMTRVQYRVGRIGEVKAGASLTVGYRIGSGERTVVQTHNSSDFEESAASKYANYDVVSFDLPTDQAGNFTVTWEASGINGSQGFLLTDVSIVMQNSFNTEHALVEDFVVEKLVDASSEANQETVKNVVMSWPGAENADGTTWRYRLYAYGADGTGNWGINDIKLHGITMSPRGMDVTDGDLRHATWVNSLEVVDGEPSGLDTAKSGLWLTGDKAPTYTLSYPAADTSHSGTFASGTFAYEEGKIRKAAYSSLADGDFEEDPTRWTLTEATIAAWTGTGAHGKVLKLAGEDETASSAKKTFAVSLGSIPAAQVSGVTVSGTFDAKAALAESSGGVNGLTVTVRLKDTGGSTLLEKVFTYDTVAAWHHLEIGPWSADSTLVRNAEVEIAQTTSAGTEIAVDNVSLQVATWGAPTSDFANGELGAKLSLKTAAVAKQELKLSKELTGEGSKEYVLESTVHDYDNDRTDDALAVTVEKGFELCDDDEQAPLLGSKFGGPVGMRLGNRAGSPYNHSGTSVQIVLTDQQMEVAARDSQTLAYLDIDGYDQSGWTTTALSLDYTEGGTAKSLAYDGADVTEGAAGLPSATNTFHYKLTTSAGLWANTFVQSQFASYTADMTVNATLTDQDDDRTADSLATTSKLGTIKFMDNDTTAPAMRTSGSLKGMFIATNPPGGSIETALSGVSNASWAAATKSTYEVRVLSSSEGDAASDRVQLIYDGELRRSAPFYLMANVGDALQSGTGVSISGLQRGDRITRTIKNGFNDDVAYTNTTMVLSNSATIVTNLATHFNEGYSSAFKTTRGGTATAPQTWYWPTGMSAEEVGFLLPAESTFLDFRVLVEAFDCDTNRPGDQAHARLVGPTLRVRDDDTLGPNAPGSPVLWANGAAFTGDPEGVDIRHQVPWTNNTSGLSVHFVEATDKDGTSTGADKASAVDANGLYDLNTSGIGGYWWAAPDVVISTTADATALELGADSTDSGVVKKTASLSVTMDQGYGSYQLFAVDDDADRDGDASIGVDAGVLLGFDETPPPQIGTGSGKAFRLDADPDNTDDPTTQFDLTWPTKVGDGMVNLGPDDTLSDEYAAIPASFKKGPDSLSPWYSYKIYYTNFEESAVGSGDDPNDQSKSWVYKTFIKQPDDPAKKPAYLSWKSVVTTNQAVDTTAGANPYASLATVSNNAANNQKIRLYDLDFDQNYIVIIVGVDKAGNEGPAGMWSWATNNTIKFAVTAGVVRTTADISGMLEDADLEDIGMAVPGEGSPKRAAVLHWLAAGQDAKTGEFKHAVSKYYDLIYRDAASFDELGTEQWKMASTADNSGTSKTNWNYQADAGLDTPNRLRFYRASYAGRWQDAVTNAGRVTQQYPLASEEVYSMNNVVLSEGYNYVSLQGVPYTNTFRGVFGVDTDMWPADGTTAADPKGTARVEFFGAGASQSVSEWYYFGKAGQNGVWYMGETESLDVTDLLPATNAAGARVWIRSETVEGTTKWYDAQKNTEVAEPMFDNGFFARPFGLVMPNVGATNEQGEATSGWWKDHSEYDGARASKSRSVKAMLWHPILQVPTNGVVASASASATTSSAKPGARDGTASGALVFRQSVNGTKDYYNLLSLNLPVAVHPARLGLVATNADGKAVSGKMHASDGPWDADKLYSIDPATKEVRGGSMMYCDTNGKWRWVKNQLEVTGAEIKPNDMLVLISSGNAPKSWTWEYTPAQFYTLPDRHMGRKAPTPTP